MSFDSAPWVGAWIWTPDVEPPSAPSRFGGFAPATGDESIVAFRHEFSVAAQAESALVRIASNSRHILYVNGHAVHRGPIRSHARQAFFDLVDISEHVVVGLNCLAVLVRHYGFATAWWEPVPLTGPGAAGGLVCDAEIVTTDQDSKPSRNTFGSDSTWRARRLDAWTPVRPDDEISAQIPEIFDAQKLDPSWAMPGFRDGAWSDAEESAVRQFGRPISAHPPAEPFGVLEPNPLPAPRPRTLRPEAVWLAASSTTETNGLALVSATLEHASAGQHRDDQHRTRDTLPQRVTAASSIVMDFGGIVSGILAFRMIARRGVRVAVSLVESLDPLSLDSANHIEYTARGEADHYESLESMGGRYALLAVVGDGAVDVDDFSVTEWLRPRPEGTSFYCDDEALNSVHAVALRTVDLCSRDAYMDCPTREQRAWVGDSIIHQSVDLTNNSNWSLAIRNAQLLASARPDGLLPMVAAADFSNPGMVTIPDANLHWTRTVHNLYRYTGDRGLLAGLMPTFESVVRWFLSFQQDDGLLHDVTGWVLIDWAPTEVDGAVASLNGLWARALQDFAEISRWLGDEGRAQWALATHARVREGFEQFWDPERAHYVDSLRGGTRSRRLSEHAHAAAVVGGVVPESRQERLAETLLDRQRIVDPSMLIPEYNPATFFRQTLELRYEPNWDVENQLVAAQPFFRYVVHDALAQLGRADALPDLLHDWEALLASGPSALREVWRGQSYAHAWSATPARDLILHIAGISPAEPGFATVKVAPRLGPLQELEVTAPSPHGPITVRVKDGELAIESPRPVILQHPDGAENAYPAGRTRVSWPTTAPGRAP